MKCQSKIDVSITRVCGRVDNILIMGKMYECELTPTIYDPMTFEPAPPSYVVKCEDGMLRKYNADNFLTISEVREIKLKELGI